MVPSTFTTYFKDKDALLLLNRVVMSELEELIIFVLLRLNYALEATVTF